MHTDQITRSEVIWCRRGIRLLTRAGSSTTGNGSAHEKEIAAIVHCLRVGARFVVRSSHNVLCDTEEVVPARWQEF